ncbi:hypothetical protein FS935_05435 [Metabacillus litoralis]|uniref:Uncharacterized protein n=1 Tax=Metabacillus litoralis TaxID=152268 RepID=A0A5C6W270_9BACI|nr:MULTISPECIES: hypothetical protein [Metabacillus]MBM7603183.1 hypothetical protein [Metabacillus crassostreae]TXC91828.1 hypothetical protein FS935_05435 [Metabacillus litoralis]
MEKNDQNTSEKKKVSLQELMKQQLANKKSAQENGNQSKNKGLGANQKMKSQQSKKPSNTRRKMGS